MGETHSLLLERLQKIQFDMDRIDQLNVGLNTIPEAEEESQLQEVHDSIRWKQQEEHQHHVNKKIKWMEGSLDQITILLEKGKDNETIIEQQLQLHGKQWK